MATLSVQNPVAESIKNEVEPAPRSADLSSAHFGLYWNLKAGGDVALHRVQELLTERFPGARFSHFQGDVGHVMRHVTPAEAERIAKQVDVVVGTTGD